MFKATYNNDSLSRYVIHVVNSANRKILFLCHDPLEKRSNYFSTKELCEEPIIWFSYIYMVFVHFLFEHVI